LSIVALSLSLSLCIYLCLYSHTCSKLFFAPGRDLPSPGASESGSEMDDDGDDDEGDDDGDSGSEGGIDGGGDGDGDGGGAHNEGADGADGIGLDAPGPGLVGGAVGMDLVGFASADAVAAALAPHTLGIDEQSRDAAPDPHELSPSLPAT
jgi:hypothetical protein